MFSERTIRAVRAAAGADNLDSDTRAALRSALAPVLATAAHGLTVASAALDGPDPEVGAAYLLDTLESLSRALDRAAPRLSV